MKFLARVPFNFNFNVRFNLKKTETLSPLWGHKTPTKLQSLADDVHLLRLNKLQQRWTANHTTSCKFRWYLWLVTTFIGGVEYP
eukprot:scaffold3283_cov103-Alexandrium_tamarense.AAC.27